MIGSGPHSSVGHPCSNGLFYQLSAGPVPFVGPNTPTGATVNLTAPCQGCGTQYVEHACALQGMWGNQIPTWLRILESGISQACPTCGWFITVSNTVEQSPTISPEVKTFFQWVLLGALAVGTVALAKEIGGAIATAA